MSKFYSNKIMPRALAVAILFALLGVAIIVKAVYIMTARKEFWTEVSERLQVDSMIVKPTRGNILSCDGQLMASSLPEYKLYMDFKVHDRATDSTWVADLDTICRGLHRIFPKRSVADFKKHLEEGRRLKKRNLSIWPRRVDYNTYMEVKALPVFSMSKYKGGFHIESFNARRRPFGSLALRTVGALYGAKDEAYCGLELAYDSVLRGTNGYVHRRKVLNKYMSIPVKNPVPGNDILTTIDVGMQDLAERSLIDMLKRPEVNGELGVAILMEVKTGDVKAMVNLSRAADGEYYEMQNYAINHRCEPGSVFKTASILVALDDGVVDTSYTINTGNGVLMTHGRPMKDHNWHRGGYGTINVAQSLRVSSNIGVSQVIDRYYYDHPEKYVEGLYRVGINEDLGIEIAGYQKPNIRMPRKAKNGQWENWSKTAAAWMSIGYETQVAPINTVAFYNAIANDGKMMKPRFVKAIMKNGEVLQEFPPVVLKEQIASPKAIKTMQACLESVVSRGLGRKAGSWMFKVAGKTGTAQVANGKAGYRGGVVTYWLSFAGFFPADNPQYSCIVCIKKRGLPASGGGMSGVVFHHIAEGVMSKNISRNAEDARDEHSLGLPLVMRGNGQAAGEVLGGLHLTADSSMRAMMVADETSIDSMPDVRGMGARDAVFMLEERGMKVRVTGRGKVKSQSIRPGEAIKEDEVCFLELG